MKAIAGGTRVLVLLGCLIYGFYFISSSQFHAYLKQIKVILSAVKKKYYFFTSDEYGLYFFTVANRSCFDHLELHFFPKRSGMHYYCLT